MVLSVIVLFILSIFRVYKANFIILNITGEKTTLKELQSLVGKLNFFGKAIRGSRAFNRRFYNAMIGVSKPWHHIRISKGMREDILMWLNFLQSFNGVAYFPESEWMSSDILKLYTDSAGSSDLGCGAYFNGHWAFCQWPSEWLGSDIIRDITFLELVPIVMAYFIWGVQLSNKKLLLHIDNMALVSIINKQTSKSDRVMSFLRTFVSLVMKYNIIVHGKHISTFSNGAADSISRMQWSRFRQLAPQADADPQHIPEAFRSLLSTVK